MRVQDQATHHETPSTDGLHYHEGRSMEREDIHRQRTSVAPDRSMTAGEPPRRLLDDYPGTPHHGGSRRDPRDRPHAGDLVEAAET